MPLEAIVSIRPEHAVLEVLPPRWPTFELPLRSGQVVEQQLPRRKVPERTVRVARGIRRLCWYRRRRRLSGSRATGANLESLVCGHLAAPCARAHTGLLGRLLAEALMVNQANLRPASSDCRRCWQMVEEVEILAGALGSSAGIGSSASAEIIDFYCSSPVMALLLERDGAITAGASCLGRRCVARGFVDA